MFVQNMVYPFSDKNMYLNDLGKLVERFFPLRRACAMSVTTAHSWAIH